MTGDEERLIDVDVKYLFPFIIGDFESAGAEYASVAEERIDGPTFVFGFVDDVADVSFLSTVGSHGDADGWREVVLDDGVAGLDVEIDNDDVFGALLGEFDAEGLSDSVCSPCDNAHASFRSEIFAVFDLFFAHRVCSIVDCIGLNWVELGCVVLCLSIQSFSVLCWFLSVLYSVGRIDDSCT